MFPQSVLEEIRSRLSIVQVIGEFLPLKKSGRNYKGLCPFHTEKTPSFMASDEKGIYHCFGCGEGGNVFRFLMKHQGMSFVEAVEQLARRAGVALPRISQETHSSQNRKRTIALKINETAKEFFVMGLGDAKRGKSVYNYLKSRDISEDTIKQLFLGAADNRWDGFIQELKSQKLPLNVAAELGLIKKREGEGYYDFFREKVMFPIFSTSGETVGFSSRTLQKEVTEMKYVNSPDSFLYHKSRQVYGFPWARDPIRKSGVVILVEGTIDVIRLHQEGIQNVVAPLGTALTVDQMRLLMRLTKDFIVAFDGDEAGLKAAYRALPLFFELGLRPRRVRLPQGQDPDLFVAKEGKEAFLHLLEKAPSLFEDYLSYLAAKGPMNAGGRLKVWEELAPLLGRVSDPVAAGLYKRLIAERLGFEEAWIDKGLAKRRSETHLEEKRAPDRDVKPTESCEEERLLVAAILHEPQLLHELEAGLILQNQVWASVLAALKGLGKQETPFKIAGLQDELDEASASSVRTLALLDDEEIDWKKVFEDCTKRIRTRDVRSQLQGLNEEIRRCEASKEMEKVTGLLARKSALLSKLGAN